MTSNMASVPPPRPSGSTESSPLVTAHSLSVLTEYTHTLDTLPLDLSRNFADLRELDAVLSSNLSAVTNKITQLTDMLETKAASPEDRLWLLADIAEEVSRLKPGADDKIRVACHAADTLRGHKAHMTGLLDAAPDEEFGRTADRMGRKTKYPWVSDKLFGIALHPGEGGRSRHRKTLANGGTGDPSPNKRKRVAGDGDDEAIHRSPRKERTGDAPRQRSRKKCVFLSISFATGTEFYACRVERVASPTESLVSVASQMPPPPTTARQASSSRASNGAGPNKRARGQPAVVVEEPQNIPEFLPPSTSHPSLPPPFSTSTRSTNGVRAIVSEWPAGQLEGPGMPVARSFPTTPVHVDEPETESLMAPTEGEVEGEDLTPYCFCHRASFGQMIACDQVGCAVEWVRFPELSDTLRC